MKKKGIVALILFAAVPFFVYGYASPGKPTGFVSDFAGIISADEKTQLETVLSNFQKQTGNEITVVTIPALGDETIETYAVKLFEEWGIGDAEKDNGLLLLVALDDRKMRIEVGYGLEGDMTDAQASSIIRNILTPAFKEGRYGAGITQAVDTIIKVLGGQADAIPEESSSSDGGWGVILYFALLIPVWLGSVLARSKSWWAGGVVGAVIGLIINLIFATYIWIFILAILGLIFDFIVSKAYHSSVSKGANPPWWIGGGHGGGFGGGGGGFGGFGGGGSGGGGSSGGW